uniref:No apical meristem-associated C-terminal domain-containing protein n=1 Tax=Lactuca sativa TaxID=4236 RepID=A0A9R1WNQ4_LACSA|nr:hypothetical protein LSAT_V11C100003350 [Lactuca sativa]
MGLGHAWGINRKPNNAFALDTTSRQFPTMESPQGAFSSFQQQQIQQYQVFQQFQQQQFQPQPSQPPHSSYFVSETQPSPPPQCEKKKGKKLVRPKKGSHGQKRKMKSDSQTFGCFWEKVCAVFYELTGSESRNPDQISSKWGDIRLKCTEFGGIYNILLNIRKTDALKWKEQTEASSQSSISKCSINPDATSQQSNGQTDFNIDDDPLNLEDEQPLRRQVERNKAKKSGFNGFGIWCYGLIWREI